MDSENIYEVASATGDFLSRVSAMRGGPLSDDAYLSLLSADVIARGTTKCDYTPACFVGEASGAIEERNVRRAKPRADILGVIQSEPSSAFTYGLHIRDPVRSLAEDMGVEIVIVATPDGMHGEPISAE